MSVNGGAYYGPDVPFGGYRQSGVGRESGIAGFEEYLEIKALAEGIRERMSEPSGSGPRPLAGKRVLLIGASAGIGRALAIRLVRDGAQVVMAARRGGELEKTAAEAGGGIPVQADITSAEDCERLAGVVRERLGRPTSSSPASASRYCG